MPKIIAFCGVKRSGKTTAFETIKEQFPQVEELTLAKKIKDVCASVFDIDRESFDDQRVKEVEVDPPIYLTDDVIVEILKEYSVTLDFEKHVRNHMGKICHTRRELLQYVGTDILKAVDPEIHSKIVTKNLKPDGIYILTDLRFPDEEVFFSDLDCDFYPYYIHNNIAESIASKDKHPSEMLVLETAKKCEYLDNNRSLDDFKKLVISTAKNIPGVL